MFAKNTYQSVTRSEKIVRRQQQRLCVFIRFSCALNIFRGGDPYGANDVVGFEAT